MHQLDSSLSPVGREVQAFYRHLPFNIADTPETMATSIKGFNGVTEYPPLARLLSPHTNVLDVGSGASWLSNSIAYHYRAQVVGIDFNPVAVEFSAQVGAALRTNAHFQQENLFTFSPLAPFDVVVSLGVLHHTEDCMAALRHLCKHTVRPGGHIFIGLYHLYGRKPFLEHFRNLSRQGRSLQEQEMEFARLFGQQSLDDTHLHSWFRDQVLHPFETQHTLAECVDILQSENMELLASSLNEYAPIASPKRLFAMEATLEEVGQKALDEGRYYPGFFCFLARRKA